MKKLHHFVRGGGGGEGGRLEVGYGMKGLGVMVKIFYSLSFVDFPGVWGGVMGEWMEIFLFYLNFETKEGDDFFHFSPFFSLLSFSFSPFPSFPSLYLFSPSPS